MSYFRNYALDAKHEDVRTAVLVVHGVSHNADEYFASVGDAARAAGVEETTLVIAPLFAAPHADAAPEDLAWRSGVYETGGEGHAASGAHAASFDVVDAFLAELGARARFPNLDFVVVTGHSAGGQLTQRYLAHGRAEQLLPGLKVRYVVTNPSSYMYLDDARYVEGRGFVRKDPSFDACPGYDDYRYGVAQRPERLERAVSDAALRQRYVRSDVVYFLGESDTCNSSLEPCDDRSLSKTCQSMLQGPTRLERGRRFMRYLEELYPAAHHALVTVPGVGHTGRGMYTSAIARRILFDSAPVAR